MLASLALFLSVAHAQNLPAVTAPPPVGEIRVDARVPAEILVDGLAIGQLFVASELRAPIAAGERKVSVVRSGRPEVLVVDVQPDQPVYLVVGKTGTTVGTAAASRAVATGPAALEVRVAGDASMQLRLDDSRIALAPGQVMSLQLSPGKHPISVRSANGTVVWAAGNLDVRGEAVLQLAEGRMPEITGDAAFLADGR